MKHGNPCGASYGNDSKEVLRNTVDGDPLAIFGGLVITNFEIDEDDANILMHHNVKGKRRLLDGIIAPSYTSATFDILHERAKCRLVVNSALETRAITKLDMNVRFRYGRGVILVQSNYDFVLDLVKASPPVEKNQYDVIFAWAIGCTSNSNTITIVSDSYLKGNGVRQQARVYCCELAVERARSANS